MRKIPNVALVAAIAGVGIAPATAPVLGWLEPSGNFRLENSRSLSVDGGKRTRKGRRVRDPNAGQFQRADEES